MPNITEDETISLCAGELPTQLTPESGYSYLWDDNSTGTSLEVNSFGTYTVVISNANGCSLTKTYHVTENPTPTVNDVEEEFCINDLSGNQIDLTQFNSTISSDGDTFTFYQSTTDYNNDNPITNSSNYPIDVGVYSFIVKVENAYCSSTSTLEISIFEMPNITEDEIISLCAGELPIQLTPESGYSYLWDDNSTGTSLEVNSFGTYSVVISNANNCSLTKTYHVTESPTPQIDHIEHNGFTTRVIPTNNSSSLLYRVDGGAWQSDNVFYNLSQGMHYFQLKYESGCTSEETSFYITNFHNVITPNGDGINDYFEVPGTTEEKSLQIYNRYGKLVYKNESSSYIRWDGKLNGKPLPQGDYWYIFTINDQKYKGHITIVNHN